MRFPTAAAPTTRTPESSAYRISLCPRGQRSVGKIAVQKADRCNGEFRAREDVPVTGGRTTISGIGRPIPEGEEGPPKTIATMRLPPSEKRDFPRHIIAAWRPSPSPRDCSRGRCTLRLPGLRPTRPGRDRRRAKDGRRSRGPARPTRGDAG